MQNIKIEYKEVPRWSPQDPEMLEYMDENGFAVVANVLSREETNTAIGLIWDYLEELGTGIDRNDVATWDNDRWPTAVHGGILPSHGIGHSKAQWYIRNVPTVKKAFANLWQNDELLVSFDGIALWRPWTYKRNWKTNEGPSWLHIDQHPIGRPGKHCVQGLVNLLQTSPQTGG